MYKKLFLLGLIVLFILPIVYGQTEVIINSSRADFIGRAGAPDLPPPSQYFPEPPSNRTGRVAWAGIDEVTDDNSLSPGGKGYHLFSFKLPNNDFTELNFSYTFGIDGASNVHMFLWNWSADSYVWFANFSHPIGVGGLDMQNISNTTTNAFDFLGKSGGNENNLSIIAFYVNPTVGSKTVSADFLQLNYTTTNQTNITTLEFPPTGSVNSSTSQHFRCSGLTQGINIDNVTFALSDSSQAIVSTTFRNLADASTQNETFDVASLADDRYLWNCYYDNVDGITFGASFNSSVSVDTSGPNITALLDTNISNLPTFNLNYTFQENNPFNCTFSLNGAGNVSFSSCGSNATITPAVGHNQVFFHIEDDLGRNDSDFANFTSINANIVANSTFNSNVTEGSLQFFTWQVSNGSSILVSASFTYNNTIRTPTSVSNGTALNFSISFDIGRTSGDFLINLFDDQNFEFNATFQSGADQVNVSSGLETQQKHKAILEGCLQFNNTFAFNFTVRDEQTNLTLGNSTLEHIYSPLDSSGSILRVHNFTTFLNDPSFNPANFSQICIYPEFGNFTADTRVHYSNGPNYDEREFLFEAFRVDNATNREILFLLLGSVSTEVTINVRDQSDNALEGYEVSAFKFNTITNDFDFIESSLTDFAGQTKMFLDNTKTYRFIIRLNGELVQQNDNIRLIGTSPELFFIISIGVEEPINTIIDTRAFDNTLVFNASGGGNVSFTWNDSGNRFSLKCLRVRNNTAGDTTELINSCFATSTGNINLSLLGSAGFFLGEAYGISAIDASRQTFAILNIDLRDITALTIFGSDTKDGLFFTTMIVMTMSGIGLSTGNPVITVIMAIVGVIIATAMNFLELTYAAIIALIALGGLIIYMLRT